jgi:hypothetical protein
MAITHNVTLRDGFASDVAAAVDAGAGVGNCVLLTGATEVSTIPLETPPFSAPSAGVITLDVIPVPEDPSATGNASAVDSMEFQDSDANVVFTGDNITGVAGGGDLELSKNPIDATDIVQLTAFTYTASP